MRNGDWTYDLLKEYSSTLQNDVNGDGKLEWGTDVFGLALQDEVVVPLLLGTGSKVIDMHSDGTYEYQLGSESVMTALERTWNFMNTTTARF